MAVITSLQMKKLSKYFICLHWRDSKHIYAFFSARVDVEDDDGWDFGTVKAAASPLPKPAAPQMQTSPSQYSITHLNGVPSSPSMQQLPRITPIGQSNPQSSSPHPASRVYTLMVS